MIQVGNSVGVSSVPGDQNLKRNNTGQTHWAYIYGPVQGLRGKNF